MSPSKPATRDRTARHPWLMAVAVWLGTALLAADEGWVIERFEVHFDIRPDGTIVAREALDVDFRGLSKHGIYRDLVYLLEFDETRNREYDISLQGVTAADGRRHRVDELVEGDRQRFRIGDPDRTISGRETYRIGYEIRHAFNGFADHDELYWNATGTWPVTINAAAVTVTAPEAALQRVECFQGIAGSTERCNSRLTPALATFSSTRELTEGEQLTIVAALRKGVIPPPGPRLVSRPRDITRFFDRTPGIAAAAATSAVAVIGGVILLWWRLGRDRRYVSLHYLSQTKEEETVPLFSSDPIVVEFKPPDGMRPGQMGLLFDERADTLDVTATIIDLAVRGFLTITELPKTGWFGRTDWQLTRLKDPDETPLAYERIILRGLFGSSSSKKLSQLKNTFYDDLARAKKALYEDAVSRKWFPRNPNSTRNAARLLGLAALAIGLVLTVVLGRQWGAGLLGLPLAAGGLLLTMFSRAMPRRTAAGREALRRALGFARYMRTAEKHQQAFAERATIFTSYLPYAIAMKCVDRWARAFKDIDVQAATATWYSGGSRFDAGSFTNNLGSFSSSVSQTLSSTPGGSGGSGFSGGSSGGGGGGGGGGSW